MQAGRRTSGWLTACTIVLMASVGGHQLQPQPWGAAPGDPAYSPQAKQDRVARLPGWGELSNTLNWFAGFVTLNETSGKSFYYSLVESQDQEAPLLLWLNGGPGCSSIGGGLMAEIGPLFPTTSGQLQANPYSWHRVANLLFVDSPAFVGFSYSNDTSDLAMSDESTAQDNLEFLLRWLERFPTFRGRPFWLAGESFAGHFIPYLSLKILTWNDAAQSGSQRINLQGFLLGNPLIDGASDNKASVETWWAHGFISAEVKKGLDDNCDYSTFDAHRPEDTPEELQPADITAPASEQMVLQAETPMQQTRREACQQFAAQADSMMEGINQYDFVADVCLPSAVGPPPLLRWFRMLQQGSSDTYMQPSHSGASCCDPCLSRAVEQYLNDPRVQRAIHANTTSHWLPYRWTSCTSRVQYDVHDLFASMLPQIRQLVKRDLRLLVYSGDLDSILPTAGTRQWIESLSLPVVKEWRSWRSSTQQVGGFAVDYQGLSFTTVRGAGHQAPYSQAERSFHMLTTWLEGRYL